MDKLKKLWLEYRYANALSTWNSKWGSSRSAEDKAHEAHELFVSYKEQKSRLNEVEISELTAFELANPVLRHDQVTDHPRNLIAAA
jgi:hypothetical protein